MGAVLRVRLEIWEVEPTRHEGERGEKPGMPFGSPATLRCLRIWEEETSRESRSVIVDGLGLRWPRNSGEAGHMHWGSQERGWTQTRGSCQPTEATQSTALGDVG